ncbi:NADPH-dependent oxidoreductase [Paenibacillus lignilyticus]|uniref:NADPH-dependent oxidoreductase n=1 Tax=Paenibacillus lignilyticus TaxID=1172615 RepID=A0ABS5CB78_9BACL|nr:NADPH-dependent oxidoreductase [Paenibacillus lignilyticus]MBP3963220.1 NADPH-dependent oxidoreductase [Paenibacillus lignilyticus]
MNHTTSGKMTNEVLSTIMNHRSIRKFKDERLPREQVETIVRAAQMAASSSFMQAYSIIGLTDPTLKRELRDITRTPYVEENGHLFIFCADLQRLTVMADEQEKQDMKVMLESSMAYQIAIVDATLAAQNAVLAAESLGLGTVIMGAVKKDIVRLDQMLGLPEYVTSLFGIAVGVPDQQPELKPRLPLEAVYFENRYATDEEQQELIAAYDRDINEYYWTRSENNRMDNWSRKHIEKLTKKISLSGMTEYVQSKGMNVN